MLRLPALLIGFGLLLASREAAGAAEAAGKAKSAYVDLQTIGFPAVVHGRLVNYVFVQFRLDVAPGVDASKIQQGEPFLRDTLVHVSSHATFNPPDNGVQVDAPRLKAQVMKAARDQFGAGKVVGVEIMSQTPQRRVGVPGAASLAMSPPPPD